jgi:hypothetical protein
LKPLKYLLITKKSGLNSELSEDSKLREVVKNVLNLFVSINTVVTFTKNVAPIAIAASDIASKDFLN